MELVASGYNRDHGEKIIAIRDLAEARSSYNGYARSGVYLDITEGRENSPFGVRVIGKGNLELRFYAKITLNGEYVVRQTLTRKEIAKLFFAVHQDCPLGELVEILSEVKDARSSRDYPLILEKNVKEIGLSEQVVSWLHANSVWQIGDLVRNTESQLEQFSDAPFPHVINEISSRLSPHGLWLGMSVRGWQTGGSMLYQKLDDLDFSVRTTNCLKNDGVNYVGELVQRTEFELLRTPNFGRKSLAEIKEILANYDLRLGMNFSSWKAPEQ